MNIASKLTLVGIFAVSSLAAASLDKDLVRGRIRAHMREFRACYENALAKEPKLAGRVTAKFVVGKDGKVSSSVAEGMPAINSCVARVIEKIEFPANNRDAFTVNYPFEFHR